MKMPLSASPELPGMILATLKYSPPLRGLGAWWVKLIEFILFCLFLVLSHTKLNSK